MSETINVPGTDIRVTPIQAFAAVGGVALFILLIRARSTPAGTEAQITPAGMLSSELSQRFREVADMIGRLQPGTDPILPPTGTVPPTGLQPGDPCTGGFWCEEGVWNPPAWAIPAPAPAPAPPPTITPPPSTNGLQPGDPCSSGIYCVNGIWNPPLALPLEPEPEPELPPVTEPPPPSTGPQPGDPCTGGEYCDGGIWNPPPAGGSGGSMRIVTQRITGIRVFEPEARSFMPLSSFGIGPGVPILETGLGYSIARVQLQAVTLRSPGSGVDLG
jgi:hypothetical protein